MSPLSRLAPEVHVLSDHLKITLSGLAAAAALRRTVMIPYSTITRAEVGAPEWPEALPRWRVGTHLPGVTARGSFTTWKGEKRFYSIGRSAHEALTLHLRDHPEFDRVVVEAHDAADLHRRIEEHRKRA